MFWYRISRRQRRAIRDILAAYRNDSELVLPKLRQNGDLPIVRIFLEALELDYAPPQAFRLALEGATGAELPLLQRFNPVFLVRDPQQREILFDRDTARQMLFEVSGKTPTFDLISKSHANLLRQWMQL